MSSRNDQNSRHSKAAFALVESLAVVFIILIAAAILLAAAPYERRTAMLNRDLANLRQMAAWTANYGNDFNDAHPSFSWEAGTTPSTYPDLRMASTTIEATAYQAVDIIRRRSGNDYFPKIAGWLPHTRFNHLVLADYLEQSLPETSYVATGDKHRMNWLDDPENKYNRGYWLPYQGPAGGGPRSHDPVYPYSSSYQTPSAFWNKPNGSSVLSQYSEYFLYWIGGTFGQSQLSEVVFPAQKVMLHDYGSWYTSKTPRYFAHEDAAATVVMADGAAALRQTKDANVGWSPTRPTSTAPTSYTYTPTAWEPQPSDPSGTDRYKGYYRWTRGSLDGRDFDGPEIDTGQK